MSSWRESDVALRLVGGAFVVAVVLPFVLWPVYGGPLVWPGLVGNFTASLLAFLCALAWDRREKHREREQEASDYEERAEQARDEELVDRKNEARRRFGIVLTELRANAASLDKATQGNIRGARRARRSP
jgi:hypothetical protein